jgi:hypothetical protein
LQSLEQKEKEEIEKKDEPEQKPPRFTNIEEDKSISAINIKVEHEVFFISKLK